MSANDHEEAPMEPAAPPTTIDYEALVRARITLEAESQRIYSGVATSDNAKYDGIIYQQLQVAENAVFQALNVLSAYGGDLEAGRLVHVRQWPPPAEEE